MATQTERDNAEATTLVESIRKNQTPGSGQIPFDTSEGRVLFEQLNDGFGSLTPQNPRYRNMHTGNMIDVLGIGVYAQHDDVELRRRIVVLLRNMRRANKHRATPARPNHRSI